MIGVTIGIGGLWPEIAARSARRMEKMTGLHCVALHIDRFTHVTPDVVHPSWLKCHIDKIFSVQHRFLVFDADMFCLNPWDPAALFAETCQSFCAVPDRNLPTVYNECCARGLPFPDWYVNGGLVMFNQKHRGVWDLTWQKHPRFGRWLEQTALNKSIQESGIDICRLSRKFNRLPDRPGAGVTTGAIQDMASAGTINFHYADCGGDGSKILALQKELGYE